jgi:phage/plasmid-like protein (TIGR03299 family)
VAHEITLSDRFGEVRKTGQRAWHGLGIEIEPGLTAVEGFKRIGLGWETELTPLTTVVETANGTIRIPLPDHQAHVRLDNLEILGVVGDGYQKIPNQDVAQFADALTGLQGGVEMETGGSLRGGRRIFALVKLPKLIEVTDQDILAQYILLCNSHDGTAAFQCYPTSVRVVCANTLRMSERDLGRGIKFRHTGDIQQKIAFAQQALGIVLKESERLEAMVKALRATNLTSSSTREMMLEVYNETFGAVDDTNPKSVERRDKIVGEWEANLSDERQMLDGIRGTAWAAYNAVSQWHDHERGRFRSVLESDSRIHSNLFGVSHRHKKVAFGAAMART